MTKKMLIKKWAKRWSPFYPSAAWYRVRLFSLFCTINLLPQRGLQAVDIHLGLELIAASFLVMIWGNPPHSPLLEHDPATAVMLDCLGHIFPFISPGTEMDVGQALQPSVDSPCVQHRTPVLLCVGTPNLYRAKEERHLFPQPIVSWDPEGAKMRRSPRAHVHWEICRPKTAFLHQKSNYYMLTWRKTGD